MTSTNPVVANALAANDVMFRNPDTNKEYSGRQRTDFNKKYARSVRAITDELKNLIAKSEKIKTDLGSHVAWDGNTERFLNENVTNPLKQALAKINPYA